MRSVVAKTCNRCSKFEAVFRPHRSPASLCVACVKLLVREHGPQMGVGVAIERVRVQTEVCICCGKSGSVLVRRSELRAWRSGELAQHAFKHLSAPAREQLISGIHPACWAKTFEGSEA